MIAEEELYELACQDMPVTSPEVREALEKFKRAYAHELAEQQRQWNGPESIEERWCAGVSDAADLIDPEALSPE